MKKKVLNIFKAFVTGFVVVAIVLLLCVFLAPAVGVELKVGWEPTFSLEREAAPVFHFSWFMPLLVGVLFAIVQFFEDFETPLNKAYWKVVKGDDAHDIVFLLWHGAWGLALGFVVSMFLFAILLGSRGSYSIPLLFTATAQGALVKGSTGIMSVSTVLGLLYGAWRVGERKMPRKALKRKAKKK